MAGKILTGGEFKTIFEECAPTFSDEYGGIDWHNFNMSIAGGKLTSQDQCVFMMPLQSFQDDWTAFWESMFGSVGICSNTVAMSGMTSRIPSYKLYSLEDLTYDPRDIWHELRLDRYISVSITGLSRSLDFQFSEIKLFAQSDDDYFLFECGSIKSSDTIKENGVYSDSIVRAGQALVCALTHTGITSANNVSVNFYDTNNTLIATLSQKTTVSTSIICTGGTLTISQIKQFNNLARVEITGTIVGTSPIIRNYTFNLLNSLTLKDTLIRLDPIFQDDGTSLFNSDPNVAVTIYDDVFDKTKWTDSNNVSTYSSGYLHIPWDEVHSILTSEASRGTHCNLRVTFYSQGAIITLYYVLAPISTNDTNKQQYDVFNGDYVYLDMSNTRENNNSFATKMSFFSSGGGALGATEGGFYFRAPNTWTEDYDSNCSSAYISSANTSNNRTYGCPNLHMMYISPSNGYHTMSTYYNGTNITSTSIPFASSYTKVNFLPTSNSLNIITLGKDLSLGQVQFRYR